MIVNFDKSTAWKRILTGKIIGFAIITVLSALGGLGWAFGGSFLFSTLRNPIPVDYPTLGVLAAIGLVAIGYVWSGIADWLMIRSLVYEVEHDKLTETYSIITKTRNQARLQVVNDVNINQDLMGKMFGIVSLDVCYGFGDEGYTFTFNYLTEREAERIEKLVKPKEEQSISNNEANTMKAFPECHAEYSDAVCSRLKGHKGAHIAVCVDLDKVADCPEEYIAEIWVGKKTYGLKQYDWNDELKKDIAAVSKGSQSQR